MSLKQSQVRAAKIILLACFLVALFTGAGFAGHSFVERQKEKKEEAAALASLKNFSELCLQRFPAKNASEKIKNLRHCVFVNSKFNTEDKNVPLWDDKDKMASWLLDYASKKRKEPPPMECSYRSGTLVGMLTSQGFQARDVVITRNEDDFNDHVVIVVLNPDTQKWEVHDPSYDVEFLSLKDRQPLGIKRMLRFGTDQFEPCNFEGQCGWDMKTSEGFDLAFNRGYWNVAWIKASKTLYVSERFDENRQRTVYGKNLSFCEWRDKWCEHQIIHLQ